MVNGEAERDEKEEVDDKEEGIYLETHALSDVEQSSAVRLLEELAQSGEFDETKLDNWKDEFSKLNSLLSCSEKQRSSLWKQSKQLYLQLQEERAKAEAASSGASSSNKASADAESPALLALKHDADQANHDASKAMERERHAEEELEDLQRQRDEYREQLEEAEREYAARMEPQIKRLRNEAAELQEELQTEKNKSDAAQKEKNELQRRLQEVRDEHADLQQQYDHERSRYAEVYDSPERVKKQIEGLENSIKTLQNQQDKAQRNVNDIENKNEQTNKRIINLNEDYSKVSNYLERLQISADQKQREIDEKNSKLEREVADSEAHKEEQTRLHAELKHMLESQRQEQDVLSQTKMEKNRMLKQLKKAREQLKEEQSRISPLENEKANLKNEIAKLDSEVQDIQKQNEEIRKDVDVHTNSFLKEETFGKERSLHVQQANEQVSELENEINALREDEQSRHKHIRELAQQRESLSRLASSRENKHRELQEQVRLKDLVVKDLKNKHKQVMSRLKDFQQLYNLVKNQRNKFVSLIQSSSQSISEMKEKLKVLSNEVEILRNESANKDKMLSKAHSDYSSVKVERDQERNDLNKELYRVKEKQQQDQQLYQESLRLNHIINDMEDHMRKLKKDYERQVELRNWRGLTLIDRNDELCILHEKSNMHERIIKKGEVELKKREDEAKALRLEVKEVERSIAATRKLVPKVPELDMHIASLRKEYHDTRRKAQELSDKVESPANSQRYRELGGAMPEKSELIAKQNKLEERLNEKKEQLLEKELVLDEVSSMADKLRQQAAEGRNETLDLAKRVNEHQKKIREMNRRMKATVSELSMSQATSLKLQSDKAELAQLVDDAKRRWFDEGLPPTEDAERELQRMQEEDERLVSLHERQEEEQALEEMAAAQSTAEERPTSYVPAELGVPKPFGANAPFKPQEAGANMRHFHAHATARSQALDEHEQHAAEEGQTRQEDSNQHR